MSEIQQVNTSGQDKMLAIIEKVALDPNSDVDKLKELLAMKEHIFDKNAEIAFNEAMSIVQRKIPSVLKTANNAQTKSKYATLDLIIKTCSPTWTNEGFALSFGTDKSEIENHIGITCIVSHSSGFSRSYRWDLPLDKAGIQGTVNKTPIHASGSTVSYGRRYLTCMIFNIATSDDNDAQQPAKELPRVSVDQVIVIEDLIKETGVDKAKFLKFLKVDSVENIPAQVYDYAVKQLEAKRK